jgi:hypothetical protein
LRVSKNETTELPFRYVKGEDGEPIMAKVRLRLFQRPSDRADVIEQGMVDLIKADSKRGVGDLL